METIFNKEGDKTLANILGFVYNSFEFEDIHTFVLRATDDVCNYIGKPIYLKALKYYENSYSLSVTGEFDELVRSIQFAIAYGAYSKFAPNNDVSHQGSGRKMLLDSDTEKSAFEWQIIASNQALSQQYYYFLDRLISFLEDHKNIDGYEEWKESRSGFSSEILLLKNAKEFETYFPIDASGVFYYRTKTIIKEVEMELIIPLIGADIYKTLKAGDTLPEDLVFNIKKCLAYNTIIKAVNLFAVETLPEGLYKNVKSAFTTVNAKNAASLSEKDDYLRYLKNESDRYFKRIENLISQQNNAVSEPEEVYRYTEYKKGLRL